VHEAQEPAESSWRRDGEGMNDRTLEENWLFRLRRERFRSRASGRTHDFYVMHLPDAVNVVALTPQRQVILVRQFRAGSGRDSLETPGGLLEPGEDPLAAGARELLEETGYAGDPPERLGTVWANPSILTARSTTIVIRNARKVAAPRPDPGEEVTLELVPARSIPRMIREGRIDHALAVVGLLEWLQSRFPGPLAVPGWSGRATLAALMMNIAAVALALGLWANWANPRVGGVVVAAGLSLGVAVLIKTWSAVWKAMTL
jgi:8-oxo-dGTP pyrophosphatase MutT (NUDIX family)